MTRDTIVFCLFLSAVVYFFSMCTKDYIYNFLIKLKIKDKRESVVEFIIINKHIVNKSNYFDIHQNKFDNPKLHCSYLVDCLDKTTNKKYTINDKQIFEDYNIDDIIKLKLIENLDKNGVSIESEITKQ